MLEIRAYGAPSILVMDLEAAIEQLTPKQQGAILLTAAGYNQVEISRATGTRQAAVCRLLERARDELRRLLA